MVLKLEGHTGDEDTYSVYCPKKGKEITIDEQLFESKFTAQYPIDEIIDLVRNMMDNVTLLLHISPGLPLTIHYPLPTRDTLLKIVLLNR